MEAPEEKQWSLMGFFNVWPEWPISRNNPTFIRTPGTSSCRMWTKDGDSLLPVSVNQLQLPLWTPQQLQIILQLLPIINAPSFYKELILSLQTAVMRHPEHFYFHPTVEVPIC